MIKIEKQRWYLQSKCDIRACEILQPLQKRYWTEVVVVIVW